MKNIIAVDVFGASVIQGKEGTFYHQEGDKMTYIYVLGEKYRIHDMALLIEGDMPFIDKLQAFHFKEDVKLTGEIAIIQVDEYYVITFVTPVFSGINGPDAVNDVIVLKVGNALNDVK